MGSIFCPCSIEINGLVDLVCRQRIEFPTTRNKASLQRRLEEAVARLKNFRDLREQCGAAAGLLRDEEDESDGYDGDGVGGGHVPQVWEEGSMEGKT